MPRYHFPGSPAFLDAAASEAGRPALAVAARRDATLSAVSTLCGQAAEAEASHVAGILAEAEALSDRLRTALRASELMLADVRAGRAEAAPADPTRPTRTAPKAGSSRGGRHG